jgi:3-dehydroquinate synthase
MTRTRIPVGGNGQPAYEVVVGTGLLGELPPLAEGAEQAAILYPETLAGQASNVAEALTEARIRPLLIRVPDGEAAKTLGTAGDCWERLGQAGFTRTDVVVGLGGGATTDLAGWVAASWLRGVRVIQLPTTLLGMVDAAVGGKTGINSGAGKNLIGAFHPPAGVLADLASLRTLPERDLRAGLAEVVKSGFIADPAILDLIEADPAAALDPGSDVVSELVGRAIRVKAEIVTRDLTERGDRIFLNYGHTLAHAIERVEQYRFRHGDAVSIGLVYAAELGRATGRLDEPTAARHAAVLRALELPISYDPAAWPALLDVMRVDKKARGSKLRFVVLDGLAKPGVLADPQAEVLAGAYRRITA